MYSNYHPTSATQHTLPYNSRFQACVSIYPQPEFSKSKRLHPAAFSSAPGAMTDRWRYIPQRSNTHIQTVKQMHTNANTDLGNTSTHINTHTQTNTCLRIAVTEGDGAFSSNLANNWVAMDLTLLWLPLVTAATPTSDEGDTAWVSFEPSSCCNET